MKLQQALLLVCLFALPASAENFLILPFFNTEKTNTLDWVGESISETIREALASEGLLTLDRDAREEGFRRLSMKPYAPLTKASVIRLAESLDADYVIFGSFEVPPSIDAKETKTKRNLRLHSSALNLRPFRRGPEQSESGSLDDLAGLQSRLAWQILKAVKPKSQVSEEEFQKRQPTARADAIESYIRGMLSASPDQKMKYLAQAVRLDPKYAHANFELGRMQFQRKNYRQAADYLQKVTSANLHFRESTFLLGLSRYYLGEFPAAEQAFLTVLQQVPLGEVVNNLGAAQSRMNRPSALENFKKALDGDAADPVYHFNVGYGLFQQGELEGAAEKFRAVLDRNPDDSEATTMLGRCLRKPPAKPPARSEGLERLKENYDESTYWQLKALLEPKR